MNTTVNANWDVTISGFGTPVAAMFFWSRNTADGTENHRKFGIGAATGASNQWARSHVSDHGLATTQVAAATSSTEVVYALTSTGSFYMRVDFVTFITDGVTLHNSSLQPPPEAFFLTVVLIGGTDVVASAGSLTPNTTLDLTASVTGLSFPPTDILFCHAFNTNISFGFAHNGSPDTTFGVRNADRNSVATTASAASNDDSYVVMHGNQTSNLFSAELTSINSDGFTITTRVSTTGTVRNVGYLALGISNFSSFAGRLTTPASTGDFGVTAPSLKPQFIIQILNSVDVDNTVDTTNKGGSFGVSIGDGTAQFTHSVASEDGISSGSNTESTADDVLAILHDDDGTARFASTLTSFDTNGFTQNFSATVSGALWPYWVVQSEEAAATVSLPHRRSTNRIIHNLVR